MGNIFSIQRLGETLITRCWDCVAGQAAFICKLEDNLHALETEVEKLKARLEGVMTRVRVAEEQQQLKPLAEVEQWCSRAETLIKEADLLIEEGCQQKSKLCMGGCCSRHPMSSHKFGKQIAKKLQEVQDQWTDGDFSTVAGSGPLPSVTKRPSEPTVGLKSTFDKVWSSLQDEQVGIIGLYGLGGVGKTTLLHQINNRFLHNDFDYVILIVVSQNHEIQKLQEEVGKRIGFSNEIWKHKSLDEKANDIWNVLCKKKFTLLLDDIWEPIDLTKVGVPLPTHKNGSKVIFTTRSFDVCCQMEANNKIEVECLSQREALELFEKKVGAETLDGHPKIRELAEEVAKKCAGLPLALVTIGRAMASKKTPEEWEYAIDILRRSVAYALPEVREKMYATLKFSYDCLPDEKVRSCFLYCCLYPEDFLIRKTELIDCWNGEGFLDGSSNFRNQGYYVIRSLVDACLLEERDDQVRMHDVIRDMALWIAGESETEKCLVQNSETEKYSEQTDFKLKELLVAEKWEKVRRVSLMYHQIEKLDEMLACPNLQTLVIAWTNLHVISNSFFKFMPKLRVLDLSENIRLKELPIGIAKLVSLEYLNLSRTSIRELPAELNALIKLKYLNLEQTRDLQMIPEQLIFNFSKLQVLKMKDCGCEWPVEEVEHLKYLEVLTISFKSPSMLERALGSSKFKSCNIEAASVENLKDSWSFNFLKLANLHYLYQLLVSECGHTGEMKMESVGIASAGCFQNLRELKLHYCRNLKYASWVIFAPHLEVLDIRTCDKLKEIVNYDEVGELMRNSNLFSKLKVLQLLDLPNLETIYKYALPFPQLKKIDIIAYCPLLNKLPLNSDSAKGQMMIIEGYTDWWNCLEWEDEATRVAFLPFFKYTSNGFSDFIYFTSRYRSR